MDWKECNFKRFVKKSNIDLDLIKSLINSSSNKFKTSKMIKLSVITSSSRVSLAYDSIREILEALALKEGYKIYNHDCFSAFLLEILKEEEFSQDFNNFRKVRNKINYYGKKLSLSEAEIFLEEINKFRIEVMKKYF